MDSTPIEPRIGQGVSRRAFLRRTGQGMLVACASVLAACSTAPTPSAPPTSAPTPIPKPNTDTAPAPTAGNAAPAAPATIAPTGAAPTSPAVARGRLPSRIPFTGGPRPDLPSTGEGVDNGYFRFPADLVKSVKGPPAQGGEFTALTYLTQAAPPPIEQNAAWQSLNKRLGATLKIDYAPSSTDYITKLPTVVAGGNLPDLTFQVQAFLPNALQFITREMADLTPYLAGDAIKDYPNLANYPTPAWRNCVFNGLLYAIPTPRAQMGNVFIVRQDLVDQAGLPTQPRDADEFKRMLQALTRPQANQYGIGLTAPSAFGLASAASSTAYMMLGIFRTPNNWRVEGGKFTKDYETEEYRAAVAYVKDLVGAGVFHPNSVSYSNVQVDADFRAGRIAMWGGSWGAYTQDWDLLANVNPSAYMRAWQPFAHDGGKPVHHFATGSFGQTYLKKGSPERVKTLLRIMDYLGAPFASEEWSFLNFGERDVHHTLDAEGNPILTQQGVTELTVPWKYLTATKPELYDAKRSEEYARATQDSQKALASAGIPDPSVGLYSPTQATSGVQLANDFHAGVVDIVLNRRPYSDLAGLIQEWRNKGGDKIRTEFEGAYAEANA
jgi:putative aldouronate transport system substrate-binding protein